MPTVQFVDQNIDVSEGSGSISVRLSLSEPSDQTITVQITPRSYRSGDMDVSVATVTFEPGQTTASFSRAIYEDSIYEGDEIYGFEITSATNAFINMEGGQTILGYIRDNDGPTLPTVQFTQQNIDVSEGAGSISVSLSLSEPSDQTITVQITPLVSRR